jgi:hypothetical protein
MEPPPGATPSRNGHCRQLGATSARRNYAPGFTLESEGRRAPLARSAQVAEVARPCRVSLDIKNSTLKAGCRPAQRLVFSCVVPSGARATSAATSELGSRQDFPGHQASRTRLLQTRPLYRRTAFVANDTTLTHGLALPRGAPVPSSTQKSESRGFGSSLGTPQPEPLEHVGSRADLHSRRRSRSRLSSKTLVARPARTLTHRPKAPAQPRRPLPAPRPPVREMDVGPFQVARNAERLPHESAHGQKQPKRRLPSSKTPLSAAAFVQSSVASSANRSRHSISDAPPSESTRSQPPRYNVSAPRRLRGGPHHER